MDPSIFLGSVWGIICYNLEGSVPSQTVFGSIGTIFNIIYIYNGGNVMRYDGYAMFLCETNEINMQLHMS